MATFPTIHRYRLYTRESVTEGKWYFALSCKGCSKLIYPLEDASNGSGAANINRDETLLVPCPRCLHDDEYKASELRQVQAEESLSGFRPPRVEVSRSARKPLLPQFKKAQPIMGVGLIEDRPKVAAIVGRIITAWADIEVQCARLLARIMGTNVPAAAAVFSSLRNSRVQADALEAAAKAVLDKRDQRLFSAHMARKASLEKERNDLAHGCYGIEVSMPDAVIWVAQTDYIAFTTANETGTDAQTLEAYRKRMFVYEVGTLERIAQEIAQFHEQLGSFVGYLSITESLWRSQRYAQLCDQPHIRQEMKKPARG